VRRVSPMERNGDLQATSPAVCGTKRKSQIHSICDFGFSLECAGPRNRSSPGYELRSWEGGLGDHFGAPEATRVSAMHVCPDVFDGKIKLKDSPIAAVGQ